MNDKLLMQAYEELRGFMQVPDVPEEVKIDLLSLRRHETKLFCCTGEKIVPSDFLQGLLAELRASRWSQVLVLLRALRRK